MSITRPVAKQNDIGARLHAAEAERARRHEAAWNQAVAAIQAELDETSRTPLNQLFDAVVEQSRLPLTVVQLAFDRLTSSGAVDYAFGEGARNARLVKVA